MMKRTIRRKHHPIVILCAGMITAMLFSILPQAVSAAGPYHATASVVNDNPGAALRNDCSFPLGISFMTGNQPLKIEQLGRYMQEGNKGTHTVTVAELNAEGKLVTLCSAEVNMAGGTPGSFSYAAVDHPVVLKPNSKYYLLSREDSTVGDTWFGLTALYENAREFDISWMYYAYTLDGVTIADEGSETSGRRRGAVGLDIRYSYPSVEPTDHPEAFSSVTLGEGGLRTTGGGWALGGVITVGARDVTVTDLGRMCWEGNCQPHTVSLVDPASGAVLASVTVDMNGAAVGQYRYAGLETSVTLKAGQSYYLLSVEYQGGDAFAEGGAVWNAAGEDISLTGWVYRNPEAAAYESGEGAIAFNGLNLRYTAEQSPENPDTGVQLAAAGLAAAASAVIPAVIKSKYSRKRAGGQP